MFNDIFSFPKETTRVWDLDVPIIDDTEQKILYVYLTDEVTVPSSYAEMYHRITTLTDDYTVILSMNTPGGIIDSGLMIIDAIQKTDAWVIAEIYGEVASVGTLIVMACDELRVSSDVSFMIHNYSGAMFGKGNEMKARQNFIDDHLPKTFRKYYNGFLSEEELDKVIDGTDLWLGAEDISQRWDNKLQKEDKLK